MADGTEHPATATGAPPAEPVVTNVDAAPAVAAADVPAAPAAGDAPATVEGTPSLLEKFDSEAAAKAKDTAAADGDAAKGADAKPAEAKPADGDKAADAKGDAKADDKGEVKAADAKPEDKATDKGTEQPSLLEQATAPIVYEYALPETIRMDDATRGEFHTALDGFRTDPAKGAQALVDLHNKTMTDYAAHLLDEQHRAFNKTRADWNKEVLADEQLGGAGHQTAMGAVARMRDMFVAEKDRPAFEQFLRITGAGDHPQFLKLLHNAARLFDEPGLPPPDAKPPPNNGRAPGRSRIYDHPTSKRS